MEEAITHEWGQGVYGKSLYLPLNFAVNLNLFLKIKSISGLPWRSSGLDSGLPLQGARGRYLVGELRSHMLHSEAKIKSIFFLMEQKE